MDSSDNSSQQTNESSNLLMKEFVTNTLNTMSKYLDEDTLRKLHDTLYVNFHDIKLTRECYELSTTISNSDTKKLEYFMISKKIAGRSDESIKQYQRAVWIMRNFIQKNFDEITTADIKYYLAVQQSKNNWKANYLKTVKNYLSTFFDFLYREGLINKNPVDGIENIKVEQFILPVFTVIECEKLKNACKDVRERAMIEFFLATGVRVSELMNIKWSDININANTIIVYGKGKKERNVWFSSQAKYYMENYYKYRKDHEKVSDNDLYSSYIFTCARRSSNTGKYEKLTVGGIQTILKKIGNRAHVEDVHPHKFRRTFATTMLEKGMPLEEVKEILGHNSCDTTLSYYAHISSSKISSTYKSING